MLFLLVIPLRVEKIIQEESILFHSFAFKSSHKYTSLDSQSHIDNGNIPYAQLLHLHQTNIVYIANQTSADTTDAIAEDTSRLATPLVGGGGVGSAAVGALVDALGAFVAFVALGASVEEGDLDDLGALVDKGSLVALVEEGSLGVLGALGALVALVDEGSLVAFGALVALVDEGSLVAFGALVAAGSLVAFNCLFLTTGCSSAMAAAMSAKRRVIIVADFIFVLFRICFQRCFDVLVNLCFMMGRKC